MRSTIAVPRGVIWRRALALGLLLGGCASPRTQVSATRVTPAASYAERSIAPRPRDAASRPIRRPTKGISTSPPPRAPTYPSDPTHRPVSSDLQRSVARFTIRPSQVFNPPTPLRPWRYIVLHHSGEPNGGLASIDRFHREVNKWDECGYHFVIGNGTESGDGEIETGTRWSKQKHGAHAKPENGDEEYNEYGIGICLVGNFNIEAPTARQIEACRRLVAYLQQHCRVSASNVIGHNTVKHTDCPGRYFRLDQILTGPGYAFR